MPKVSVIIPTYNYGQYIEKAIDSVLAQSYQDFEIIVVDDGSTDNTGTIIETKYKDKVKYIFQENKGAAAARNRAAKEAKGKYLSFLDADDTFLVDNLQKKLRSWKQTQQQAWSILTDIISWGTVSGSRLSISCPLPGQSFTVKSFLCF